MNTQSPPRTPPHRTPVDIRARMAATRPGSLHSWRSMGRLGLAMLTHSKLKSIGTLFGVIFAVVLCAQQLGVLLGLLAKNTMLVENAGADIWIAPPGTVRPQAGALLDESVLMEARVTPGVAHAAPFILSGGNMLKPGGGTEAVTLIGTEYPALLGGPWNMVAGNASALGQPDTLIMEDSQRKKLGGVNIGSVRELNGHLVYVAGFTWGLLPFGPSYAFAEIDHARRLTNIADHQMNFVLVKLAPGADAEATAAALRSRLADTEVFTADGLAHSVVTSLLAEQLGISFGTSTMFGLIVGFVIVALSMFSAVVDNLREFGTLKAIGCTNRDLGRLLAIQSIAFAWVGSILGLGIATRLTEVIRSPELVPVVPVELIVGTPVVMTLLCLAASTLAMRRIRSLEPGMVFQ